MAIRKAFIKHEEDIVLPITRGELVLDADGNIALLSEAFAATDLHPGLMLPSEKRVINSIDNVPTKDSDNLVKSGGTWKHIDDIVGNIDRILETI